MPTEQVDGVIRLQDVLDRVRDGAAARAAQADGSGAADQDTLARISEPVAQLSQELARPAGPVRRHGTARGNRARPEEAP